MVNLGEKNIFYALNFMNITKMNIYRALLLVNYGEKINYS